MFNIRSRTFIYLKRNAEIRYSPYEYYISVGQDFNLELNIRFILSFCSLYMLYLFVLKKYGKWTDYEMNVLLRKMLIFLLNFQDLILIKFVGICGKISFFISLASISFDTIKTIIYGILTFHRQCTYVTLSFSVPAHRWLLRISVQKTIWTIIKVKGCEACSHEIMMIMIDGYQFQELISCRWTSIEKIYEYWRGNGETVKFKKWFLCFFKSNPPQNVCIL